MSRFHQRGRDHWSHSGRPAGFGMPLLVDRGIAWSTRIGIAIATAAIVYFVAELLRGWH
jgi:hypothetical protein